ncbi:MAG: glycosyltransferase family 4 protein [Patescibacteria group bacterium]|nr:glycosyltransferase family 4 protein [Patescibacteria group bacterium]
MKVLMFGWELPPFNSGGLGVACYGLAKALSQKGVEIVFVLPQKTDVRMPFAKIIFALSEENESLLRFSAYEQPRARACGKNPENLHCFTLFNLVEKYKQAAKIIARKETFDLIHAHDWLAFPAGLEAKKISKKPLVVHVHATELDRVGNQGPNQYVWDIEKNVMEKADRIIAVSNFTKNKIVNDYGIGPEKIRVVHNGIEPAEPQSASELLGAKGKNKMVLFVGRITLQKGPDYFLTAAKKILEKNPEVIFVMAGSGDMEKQVIEKAVELGIAKKVFFAGFLRGGDLAGTFRAADVFVMPSVSEPFGIAPLEALQYGVPVIISRQSGVSEILSHCLKVDFWDTDQMANQILACLKYPALHQTLRANGETEARGITWNNSAEECINVYNEILSTKI